MKIMERLKRNGIVINYDDIVRLCVKYKVNELSIFGSSIREDFSRDSDIDMLVSFNEGHKATLFDVMDLENEFSLLFDRKADIVEKKSLKNPMRKNKILTTREIIYKA